MLAIIGFSALQHVLDAAMRVDDAVCGDIQVIEDDGSLSIVAARLDPETYERYRTVRVLVDGTPCAHAATEGRRIVIRDVYEDPGFAPHLAAAERGGWRAVQSSPLRGRSGQLIGVLTTHFPRPHHPSPGSLVRLDRKCGIAARMIECVRLGDSLAAQGRLASLPAEASRALEAVGVLLPMLGENGDATLIDVIQKELDTVTSALSQRI